MKIEVTFDKSAKKEFRDQCIKRLQSFVTQIKGKQDCTDTRRNSIVSTLEESKNSTSRDHVCAILKPHKPSASKLASPQEKVYKKQNSLARVETHAQGYNFKESTKQNKTPPQTETNLRQADSSKFDLNEMRANVNKILQKLDKSQFQQQSNHDCLEEKLETTNRKLDYLIQCIEKKGISHSDPRSRMSHNQQQERGSTSFQEKFNHLANQYYAIRERNSRSLSNVGSFSKSISSLEQTQESVTFRHI